MEISFANEDLLGLFTMNKEGSRIVYCRTPKKLACLESACMFPQTGGSLTTG